MPDWLEDAEHALEEVHRSKLSEVITELRNEYYLNVLMDNDAYHLFRNTRKNGLLDKVEKILSLRLDEFEIKNEQEKSDLLSLAKFLYIVETNCPLLKVLSKPSMADVIIYGEKSDVLDEDTLLCLMEKIKTRTTPGYADRCNNCYYEILNDWWYINSELTSLIVKAYFQIYDQEKNDAPQAYTKLTQAVKERIKDKKIKDGNEFESIIIEALKTLSREEVEQFRSFALSSSADRFHTKDKISEVIEYIESNLDYIVQSIDKEYIKKLPYYYGVFDTFYACFNRYYVVRAFSDIPNEANVGIRTSPYSERSFSQRVEKTMPFSDLKIVEKLLSGRIPKEDYRLVYVQKENMDLIYDGVPIELRDSDIRFALKHLKTVANWWLPDMLDDEKINISVAITVIQELAYLYKTKLKYTYQYNKHDDSKPFSAIISKPEKADDMFKSVMIERLNERFLANMGSDEWKRLHNMSKKVCEIVNILMSYTNVDDAQMASYVLNMHFKSIIKSCCKAQFNVDWLIEAINDRITCGVLVEKITDNNFLNRIFHEKQEDLLNTASKIARNWNEHIETGDAFVSTINVNDSICIEIFAIPKKGTIKINKLWYTMETYELNKLSQLGLGALFHV